jgi:hypothetical protein
MTTQCNPDFTSILVQSSSLNNSILTELAEENYCPDCYDRDINCEECDSCDCDTSDD